MQTDSQVLTTKGERLGLQVVGLREEGCAFLMKELAEKNGSAL